MKTLICDDFLLEHIRKFKREEIKGIEMKMKELSAEDTNGMKLLKVIKEHREKITVDILLYCIRFMHILRNSSCCELFFHGNQTNVFEFDDYDEKSFNICESRIVAELFVLKFLLKDNFDAFQAVQDFVKESLKNLNG